MCVHNERVLVDQTVKLGQLRYLWNARSETLQSLFALVVGLIKKRNEEERSVQSTDVIGTDTNEEDRSHMSYRLYLTMFNAWSVAAPYPNNDLSTKAGPAW